MQLTESNINIDKLNSADLAHAMKTVYAMVDASQNEPPHIQAIAAAILFKEISEATYLSPTRIMTVAANMAAHADQVGMNSHFKALQLYIKGELQRAP